MKPDFGRAPAPKIDSLTYTRGLAAILVVIFHYGLSVPPFSWARPVFASGNLAVSYFFVLSGFVMALNYAGKELSFKSFISKRFRRVVPAYWFALIISLLPLIRQALHGEGAADGLLGWKILLVSTFTQSLIPGFALALNPPAWSLSVEMAFYLSFPLLIHFYKKKPWLFFLFTGVTFFSTQAMLLVVRLNGVEPAFPSAAHDLLNYSPFIHMSEFLMGIAAFGWLEKSACKGLPSLPVLIMVLVGMVCVIPQIHLHNGLLGPVYGLIICRLSRTRGGAPGAQGLVFLGNISYDIYILQAPVYENFQVINSRLFGLTGVGCFYLYFAILVTCSTLCYQVFDGRLLRKRQRLVHGK